MSYIMDIDHALALADLGDHDAQVYVSDYFHSL
ncbi:hypothetical protein SEA_VERITY_9 [Gordonia phage Verity]|uniref:Uncharacterized protein n=2 Tax=Zitchvirus TaxID=2948963 RepID=A0A514DIT2_9CAUD|nr:hypothetical protein J1775_gp09 [Gordonia phage Zipp]YP_010002847.1 hypothetical protein J1776_gp09 [Gordonia phage Verity]QPO16852.1 hypothetical protein SEA_DELREY21_9 [Gordonia phage Delrey21]QXN74135.1 hypothetical protein SEA_DOCTORFROGGO_9 [Gordonia phage DoctorFroggo]QDH93163.1 hypothetical protein SEA_ZIPP_9 [Gordonia phage Zipp]QDH93495.1 hypothetical protein SEA_VERITY_9 [Gordonia phage Verity]